MATWHILGVAATLAALLRATPAAAGTVAEPIARLTLDGGWDSNVLYDGRSADTTGRIAPEGGLRLHAPLWDLRALYGGEWVVLRQLAPGGIWNHRGGLALDATPTRRTTLALEARASQAFDPSALAHAGLFRPGRQHALLVSGRGRLAWRTERDLSTALTALERLVRFDDGSGGAMHAPGAEALWRTDRRLALGVAYGFGVFQSFRPGLPDEQATSHAARLRARLRLARHVTADAWTGPAWWMPRGGSSAIVPEGFVEVLVATRGLDLRATAGHGLGIGASAQPGLVDWLEGGGERRFGRTWFVRGDGGFWRSGAAPRGADAVTGYATAGEAGVVLRRDVRLSVTAARYGRLGAGASDLSRTTVGVRLGWELRRR